MSVCGLIGYCRLSVCDGLLPFNLSGSCSLLGKWNLIYPIYRGGQMSVLSKESRGVSLPLGSRLGT
jgi:hypothetical protein